ncbi:hypothetical protein [Pseudomonas fluorescens]|uniref:Big-1 domain-containing protein n=1 Tax=Pseudomonas fluorescens TaxID=294 RepID=A0A5E6XJ67_PSEFL|nr:hypothetical protein [Pseudomonas fluorescens]VVN40705.1 hypothetical protein PS655_05418 [Pseudomonas fluorescens]
MSNPGVYANESLIRNGKFFLGLTQWNTWGAVFREGESWQGVQTSFMAIKNGGRASQDLWIPQTPGEDARYTLSFLCETRHEKSGWVFIFKGEEKLHEIELKPHNPLGHAQGQAHREAGRPLELELKEYILPLGGAFARDDTLRIEIHSPLNNENDRYSKICITHLDIQLQLDDLKLQAVRLDQEHLTPEQKVYLCVGAWLGEEQNPLPMIMPHQLSFEPEPGNAWLGTKAALLSTGNPQEAVRVEPDWGVDQLLTSAWSIHVPYKPDVPLPYEFSLSVHNQYRAEAFPICISLGHHRLVFKDKREAPYYPVLGLKQCVRLGVQVVSFYTSQTIEGCTVNWSVAGGTVKAASNTDEQGWAYYDFEPTEAGLAVIDASVESLYYASGVWTENIEVPVLANDPWKDLRAVVEGVETAWDAQGYPNRGTSHDLRVRLPLPSGSPLLETGFSLRWSGDSPEQLGVDVSPALEVPIKGTGADMVWTLSSEDKRDGSFKLSLVCSKLLSPSPPKPMSLARNRVRIGEVREANRYPIVDEAESVLLRLQAVHETVSGDGDPVTNALVEWIIPEGEPVRDVTGSGGWASLLYTPKTAGEQTVKAVLRAHDDAVSTEHDFSVKAIDTSPWKSQVSIWLDDTDVQGNPLGVLCLRGKTHTLKVLPIAGSEWFGRNISLHWRNNADPGIGLKPADLTISKPLIAQGVQWELVSDRADSHSSLFELELRLEHLPSVRELSGRLLAEDLKEEVTLMLDQVQSSLDERSLYPCLKAVHRFKVLPHALSPLVGLEASLIWTGASADSLNAKVDPRWDDPQTLSDGGATWTLDFGGSEKPAEFALALVLPHLQFEAVAKPMVLDHNKLRIEAWRESAVDPVMNQDAAWMWVQVYSPHTEKPVDQAPVSWTIDAEPREIHTTVDGWSGFEFKPQEAGEQSVIATVLSRFDGFEEHRPMTVNALASDPWDELKVSFDLQDEQPVGTQTYFPRHNLQHVLNVIAPSDSALVGKELTLGMTGTGPAALGLQFEEPRLGDPRYFSNLGLTYAFKAHGTTDASFGLRFAATRLARLSPIIAMSLGPGEHVLKIAERQRVNQTLLWGAEVSEQVEVVSVISGRPMAGVTVTWRSPDLGEVTTTTNYYGVARVRFVPTTPGAVQLTATVGDSLYSESIALPYFLHQPREIQSLQSAEPSGHPGQEVSAHVIVISAQTGEPLVDVEVEWEYPGIKIASTKTDATGKAEVKFRLPPVREGWLLATVKGGYAGWEVKSLMFTAIPNADTWLQEFTLWLKGEEVSLEDGQLVLSRGLTYDLELRVRKHSWLIGWAQIALDFLTEAEELGIKFEPEPGTLRLVDGEPIRWGISSEMIGPVGDFAWRLISPALPDRPLSGRLSRSEINEEIEVKCNGNLTAFGGTAYPCLGASNAFLVRVKNDSPLLGSLVTLVWEGESPETLEIEVTPKLSQTLGAEFIRWSLDSNGIKNGQFSLGLSDSRGWWSTTLPVSMSLGHHLVSAERWSEIHDGPIYFYEKYGIRATSNFLKIPAPNVEVAVYRNHSPSPEFYRTDSKGEYVITVTGDHIAMSITNRYDGTVV